MILTVKKGEPLSAALEEIGFGASVKDGGSLLIKINLVHPHGAGHPRTDPFLLKEVLDYALEYRARCAIAEGADGFLLPNLESTGLGEYIRKHQIALLDLDNEPFDQIKINDEIHYLPQCLKDYAVRLAVPAASQRPGMTFSNNIKLFVGAVPRRMYQDGQAGSGRPRVHTHLHKSIVNIYRAITRYSPFGFYVNGGKAMFETTGEIDLDETLIGNDALEMDCFILKSFGLPPPEYIRNLSGKN
jgi:uncharacterized protein (DUF362 family)